MRDAEQWINQLGLLPHPEGGHFREVYRSGSVVSPENPRGMPGRPEVTSIFFLLKEGEFSAFHRLRGVELWHLLDGGPMLLHRIAPDGTYARTVLGLRMEEGEVPFCAVEPRTWFAALPRAPAPFSLVGCTVIPGFEFGDFELARREDLAQAFPQHRALIGRFALP